MTKQHGTKETGFWIAKLVATTIICALMYKGMAIFAHEDLRPEIPGGSGNHRLYMSLHVAQ